MDGDGVRVTRFGWSALRVEVDSAAHAAALATWARSAEVEAEEIVPAARTVLFDGVRDLGQIQAALTGWDGIAELRAEGPLVTLDVVYDGEDLPRVAQAWGCSVGEVVARHTAGEFVSVFCGFAPGFAYLSGLPEECRVPRLATPRPWVPAGSVAIAGEWCAVYPTGSPGGWNLLGRTDAALWDPAREDPVLLAPGTRVRFRAVP